MPPRPPKFFVPEVFASPDERLKNQASRRSPPYLLQKKLLESIPQRPHERTVPPNGPMQKALVQGKTRLAIHMLLDREDRGFGTLSTGDPKWIVVMHNPREVVHTIKLNWAEHTVPGLSHRPQHYVGTENRQISFEVAWSAYLETNGGQGFRDAVARVAYARKFLEALSAPPQASSGSIADGAPPRVLFFWENYMSLTCNIHSVTIRDSRFAPSGELLELTATFDVREVRDVRMKPMTVERYMGSSGKTGLYRTPPPRDGAPAGGRSEPSDHYGGQSPD